MSKPIAEMMLANLLNVFNERDESRRMLAISQLHAVDVAFHGPEGTVTGHSELNKAASGVLSGAPGFVFTAAGPARQVSDLGYLPWAFGLPGATPAVRGMDIALTKNGQIAQLFTLLALDA
jgi:hypothetical protein